ncbi:hypothetical protein GCM10007989_25190 [Devosia pacifica]|uniref:PRC-barrel domain-containing protein n=1 Tax=Devosia pacifica TaxID=1335967 RepID=A0A918S7R7_9HYPH|nr:PRC-barrel domain-containing protein [Devosia pacifica]GHA28141.1 hypothetical protein GCM10007989_25190 [Devosia pacifica]
MIRNIPITLGLLAAATSISVAQVPEVDLPGDTRSSSQLEQVGLTPPTVMSEGHQVTSEETLASVIFGQQIHDSTNAQAELIGTVEDLVIGPLGDVSAAIVDVGAYLGVSSKFVAIDFQDLSRTPVSDGTTRWVLETTRDSLAGAPEFQWPQTSDASPQVPDTPAEEQQQMVGEEEQTGQTIDPTMTTDQAENAAPGLEESGAAVDPQPEELRGMGVYGVNDEPIGTINEVLADPNGQIDALVIDVGGFLGLGAKPVAVAYENLSFGADITGDRYLYLNTSRQALEAQPTYNPQTYPQERATQRMLIQP